MALQGLLKRQRSGSEPLKSELLAMFLVVLLLLLLWWWWWWLFAVAVVACVAATGRFVDVGVDPLPDTARQSKAMVAFIG